MPDLLIDDSSVGKILRVEYMEPMDISAYKLAKDIRVPVSRIQEILKDKRKITLDTSVRLAKYFGVAECFFLDLQNDIDLRKLKETIGQEIDQIQPVKPKM